VINSCDIALFDWLHDCSERNLFSPYFGARTFLLALIVLSYRHAGAWIRIPLKAQVLLRFAVCCKMVQAFPWVGEQLFGWTRCCLYIHTRRSV